MSGRLRVKSRPAFTLIEFLVVMGIIAALLACLLPALLGARDASRRVSCVNNLKEIALALQSYLNTYNSLPSGSYDTVRPVSSEPGGYHMGWIVSILPYMEQNGLYRSFDFNFGAEDPINQRVAVAQFRTLTCPTAGSLGSSATSWWVPASVPPTTAGTSSYAGVHHDVEAPIDEDNHGVLFLNSRVRVVDISDGLSQTLMIGELAAASQQSWALGTRATLRNTGHPINGVTASAVKLADPTATEVPAEANAVGLEQMIQAGRTTVAPTFVGGFGSTHAGGGANFALGDGSVRWIKETIDQEVYRRLGHRCDGEVIDDGEF
jgi:prepilin-type N-terminal cleavage/methylation domain-containing protein/prepilin-type processing-associated H-X9-DG protein